MSRGRGDKRRGAHQEPGREDRSARRETRPLPSDAGSARANRRGPDIADRSGQPRHGRPGVAVELPAFKWLVDAKLVIVEQAVTNQVVDMRLLTRPRVSVKSWASRRSMSSPIAATSKSRTSRPVRGSVAFRTFPDRNAAPRSARASFARTSFATTRGATPHVCPAGKVLTPIRHPAGCAISPKSITVIEEPVVTCPMRARCTNDVRSVSRLENEAVLDRMAERLKKRPEILDRRREVVEHPFGQHQASGCIRASS